MSKRGQVTEVDLMSAPSKQFLHDPSAMPVKGQEGALVLLSDICKQLNPYGERVVRKDGEVDVVVYNRMYALVSTIPEARRTAQEDQFMGWHDEWCSKYEKGESVHNAMMKGFLDHQKATERS